MRIVCCEGVSFICSRFTLAKRNVIKIFVRTNWSPNVFDKQCKRCVCFCLLRAFLVLAEKTKRPSNLKNVVTKVNLLASFVMEGKSCTNRWWAYKDIYKFCACLSGNAVAQR